MATRIFHISFPAEWAKEIEHEMKKNHFTPTEYFKDLYRNHRREERLYADLKESEDDLKNNRFKEAGSLAEFQ